jgi:hypothetical protein
MFKSFVTSRASLLARRARAVDFDRCCIDHVIVDTLIDEPAMQPGTIAAGLVA